MAEVPAASRHQGGVELQGFLDRAAVREAVENWGLWRDSGRFEQLRSLYTADAVVHTTWFSGSAAEFIERSSKGGGRARHFIGAVRVELNGGWRIRMRNGIYEKDRIDPVDPSKTVSLDPAALARHPAGYRHLAYLQASGGARITPDLPTPNSKELARLYSEGHAWLKGEAAA
jgi:hypothetical protein